MRVLILSFSANKVNEDSYVLNKKGLTFDCVDECINELDKKNIKSKHICMNYKNIKRCLTKNCISKFLDNRGVCYDF